MYLLELVESGQNCEGIKFYEAKKSKQQETCIQNSDCFKRGPKPKLNPEDELFMTLVWLKNAFPLYHLSWLFKIPVSTVSRHLISLVNFIYFKQGSILIWPSKEEMLETMPTSFKKNLPQYKIHNWLYRADLSDTILFEYPKLSIFKLQKSCYLQSSYGNSSVWSNYICKSTV